MFGFVRLPEPLPNRIPKAHCFSVSPTIGNTFVSGSCFSLEVEMNKVIFKE